MTGARLRVKTAFEDPAVRGAAPELNISEFTSVPKSVINVFFFFFSHVLLKLFEA